MYNAFISYSHASDDKFAPALQDALQKFAKPWYKKRNLEIFRDESSLSASPQLWNNIIKALDEAEYFILLASPLSENSKWVNKEVEYWLEHKSTDTILIALTDGEMKWDDENNCFLNPGNNSLPPALDNQFDSEPFYIDLRQSKTEKDISLDNPIFKKEILRLAAKLHNKPPNDLASEEVTVHRKTILVRNAAIGILVFLLVSAIILGVFANAKRNEADKNAKIATENQKKAEYNEKVAKENLNKFLKEEFDRNLKNANTYMEAEEYQFANLLYNRASQSANDTNNNLNISTDTLNYLRVMIDSVRKKVK
jgi:hypothetical protein